jgi:hypothetical protein
LNKLLRTTLFIVLFWKVYENRSLLNVTYLLSKLQERKREC